MTLFEAYVTNAGKYADYGVEVGEPLKFPTTTEEVQALLKRIGVDGVRYQEIFIVSFDGDVLGLYDYLSEYENLDELNHLAHLLSELDQGELETLEAVLNKGDHILVRLTAERAELANGVDQEHPALVAFMKFENIDSLSREILIELIDHIKVYENGNISVRFKFADELRKIAEYIEINTTTDPAVAG